MDSITHDINAEFGVTFGPEDFLEVGDENPQQEAAFPSAIAMPQSLPPAPVNLPSTSPNPWPPKLIMDIAMGVMEKEDVLFAHQLTEAGLDHLYTIPQFRRELSVMVRELRETGATFGGKAAMQAESYLEIMDDVMRNPETPASTRLSVFTTLAKFGGLEPTKEKEDTGTSNQINIQINI